MFLKLIGSTAAVVAFGAFAVLGTSALFTDTATIANNSFAAGTVNLTTTPTTALFTMGNMAPGDSFTDDVEVTNAGTLALRYALTSVATDADTLHLKDELDLIVKTVDVTLPGTPCDDFDGTTLFTGDLDGASGVIFGDVTAGAHTGDRTLAAATSEILCFRATLPSDAPESVQGATTEATFTFTAEQTVNN